MIQCVALTGLFQSTLPAKGSDFQIIICLMYSTISIHAPREGSDVMSLTARASILPFQSTLPAKGATKRHDDPARAAGNFNPRSPRRERPATGLPQAAPTDFNPRSPRRERRSRQATSPSRPTFQSTLPAKGATSPATVGADERPISIHAPRERERQTESRLNATSAKFQSTLPAKGSDFLSRGLCSAKRNFNPRSP